MMQAEEMTKLTAFSTCSECAANRENLRRIEEEHTARFLGIKKKIISTDLLIGKYKVQAAELNSCREKLDSVITKIKAKDRELESVEISYQKYKHEVVQLSGLKIKLETRCAKLEKDLTYKNDTITSLEATHRQISLQSQSSEKQCDEYKATINVLRGQLKQKHSKVDKSAILTEKLEKSTEINNGLRDEIRKLKGELKKQKTEHEKQIKMLQKLPPRITETTNPPQHIQSKTKPRSQSNTEERQDIDADLSVLPTEKEICSELMGACSTLTSSDDDDNSNSNSQIKVSATNKAPRRQLPKRAAKNQSTTEKAAKKQSTNDKANKPTREKTVVNKSVNEKEDAGAMTSSDSDSISSDDSDGERDYTLSPSKGDADIVLKRMIRNTALLSPLRKTPTYDHEERALPQQGLSSDSRPRRTSTNEKKSPGHSRRRISSFTKHEPKPITNTLSSPDRLTKPVPHKAGSLSPSAPVSPSTPADTARISNIDSDQGNRNTAESQPHVTANDNHLDNIPESHDTFSRPLVPALQTGNVTERTVLKALSPQRQAHTFSELIGDISSSESETEVVDEVRVPFTSTSDKSTPKTEQKIVADTKTSQNNNATLDINRTTEDAAGVSLAVTTYPNPNPTEVGKALADNQQSKYIERTESVPLKPLTDTVQQPAVADEKQAPKVTKKVIRPAVKKVVRKAAPALPALDLLSRKYPMRDSKPSSTDLDSAEGDSKSMKDEKTGGEPVSAGSSGVIQSGTAACTHVKRRIARVPSAPLFQGAADITQEPTKVTVINDKDLVKSSSEKSDSRIEAKSEDIKSDNVSTEAELPAKASDITGTEAISAIAPVHNGSVDLKPVPKKRGRPRKDAAKAIDGATNTVPSEKKKRTRKKNLQPQEEQDSKSVNSQEVTCSPDVQVSDSQEDQGSNVESKLESLGSEPSTDDKVEVNEVKLGTKKRAQTRSKPDIQQKPSNAKKWKSVPSYEDVIAQVDQPREVTKTNTNDKDQTKPSQPPIPVCVGVTPATPIALSVGVTPANELVSTKPATKRAIKSKTAAEKSHPTIDHFSVQAGYRLNDIEADEKEMNNVNVTAKVTESAWEIALRAAKYIARKQQEFSYKPESIETDHTDVVGAPKTNDSVSKQDTKTMSKDLPPGSVKAFPVLSEESQGANCDPEKVAEKQQLTSAAHILPEESQGNADVSEAMKTATQDTEQQSEACCVISPPAVTKQPEDEAKLEGQTQPGEQKAAQSDNSDSHSVSIRKSPRLKQTIPQTRKSLRIKAGEALTKTGDQVEKGSGDQKSSVRAAAVIKPETPSKEAVIPPVIDMCDTSFSDNCELQIDSNYSQNTDTSDVDSPIKPPRLSTRVYSRQAKKKQVLATPPARNLRKRKSVTSSSSETESKRGDVSDTEPPTRRRTRSSQAANNKSDVNSDMSSKSNSEVMEIDVKPIPYAGDKVKPAAAVVVQMDSVSSCDEKVIEYNIPQPSKGDEDVAEKKVQNIVLVDESPASPEMIASPPQSPTALSEPDSPMSLMIHEEPTVIPMSPDAAGGIVYDSKSHPSADRKRFDFGADAIKTLREGKIPSHKSDDVVKLVCRQSVDLEASSVEEKSISNRGQTTPRTTSNVSMENNDDNIDTLPKTQLDVSQSQPVMDIDQSTTTSGHIDDEVPSLATQGDASTIKPRRSARRKTNEETTPDESDEAVRGTDTSESSITAAPTTPCGNQQPTETPSLSKDSSQTVAGIHSSPTKELPPLSHSKSHAEYQSSLTKGKSSLSTPQPVANSSASKEQKATSIGNQAVVNNSTPTKELPTSSSIKPAENNSTPTKIKKETRRQHPSANPASTKEETTLSSGPQAAANPSSLVKKTPVSRSHVVNHFMTKEKIEPSSSQQAGENQSPNIMNSTPSTSKATQEKETPTKCALQVESDSSSDSDSDFDGDVSVSVADCKAISSMFSELGLPPLNLFPMTKALSPLKDPKVSYRGPPNLNATAVGDRNLHDVSKSGRAGVVTKKTVKHKQMKNDSGSSMMPLDMIKLTSPPKPSPSHKAAALLAKEMAARTMFSAPTGAPGAPAHKKKKKKKKGGNSSQQPKPQIFQKTSPVKGPFIDHDTQLQAQESANVSHGHVNRALLTYDDGCLFDSPDTTQSQPPKVSLHDSDLTERTMPQATSSNDKHSPSQIKHNSESTSGQSSKHAASSIKQSASAKIRMEKKIANYKEKIRKKYGVQIGEDELTDGSHLTSI